MTRQAGTEPRARVRPIVPVDGVGATPLVCVPVTGQAVPSYAPQAAMLYFKKIECFCFTSQTLAPHEVRKMPVVFVVDQTLPKDIGTITLSYTFFEVNGTRRAVTPGQG